MAEHTPHPANAPGDFYVVDGCCTMCEVPFLEARELFGVVNDPKGYTHCHVKRQPETPAELDRMVNAIRCAEFKCIRYRGADRLVELRLIGAGEGEICDGPSPHPQPRAETPEVLEAEPPRSPASPRPWWRFW